MRARLVDRYLRAVGVSGIPVTAGPASKTSNVLTQTPYAEQAPAAKHADGAAAMLAAIQAHPGEVTLIAIGPLVTVGAAIERDPGTFKKLKRVVMMGGSIYRGYGGGPGQAPPPPVPEWNVDQYPKGFAQLLAAGVPLYLMPLDSTQIKLEAARRDALFAAGNPVTDQLTLLYHQWFPRTVDHNPTPTLYDPVAAAYTFRPELCPTMPMRLAVDAKGMTTPVAGDPNAEVCLKSDEAGFLKLLETRLIR
jgi:inosine-uridine nucleoside N-ribohydrolase